MNFAWTEEQIGFRDAIVEFARAALGGDLDERDRAGTFCRELWQRCADFGILGLPVPEEYGGSDLGVMTTTLAMEALGYGCRDQGLLFSLHAHMWSVVMPVLAFGTEQQRRRYLPGLCDGSLIGAHGMSEPNSGSDAFALSTRATREDGYYRLNGSKTFVTNAPVADVFLVFATVNPSRRMWGVTAFLVERGTPGLVLPPPLRKLGLTTSPMGEVVFDDCRIPMENRLGAEGQGSAIFNHSMGWERSCILASQIGAMQYQLESCLAYARERRQFGRPIGNFQLVASRIADMKVRLETSRLLLYHAAWTHATGGSVGLDGAMAKLYVSECAVQSALDAIQIHGGYGYMKEFQVERDLRDAVGGTLYSGTSEIQRLLIARHLGLSPE